MNPEPVISVKNMSVTINGIDIVSQVDLTADGGSILALVGESGCGKSLTALSLMGLLPRAARISQGTLRLNGRDITRLSEAEMQALRGNDISMIFQEPSSALDPLMTVGDQVVEAILAHQDLSREQAEKLALEMFRQVGLSEPSIRMRQYPFELSGGMCQRIMIASALSCRPRVLIADEPTTALDVTIQAQILDLMRNLSVETGTAVILITHDLGVVAEMADRVAVMYAGRVVETGGVFDIFREAGHPYTRMLLKSIPRLDGERKKDLFIINGVVPDARNWPQGCRFNTRCPLADQVCRTQVPALEPTGPEGCLSACWHKDRIKELDQ